MASVEPAHEPLVGLQPVAKPRLSAVSAEPQQRVRQQQSVRQRVRNALAISLLVAVQLAWLAALAVGAYVFLLSG